ncbi:ATP-binding protein [Peterkaempfera bronchialis]|nr:ATP-binding protein [Peterkaempfera bronchialis]
MQSDARRDLLDARWVYPDSHGVRLARWHMASVLAEAGCDRGLVRCVEQIAAELLTNAVLHGCTKPGHRAHLKVSAEDGALLVEVLDPSTDLPRAVASRPENEHGRGLLLVEELADAWGVHEHEGVGKTVWARCSPVQLPHHPSDEEEQAC